MASAGDGRFKHTQRVLRVKPNCHGTQPPRGAPDAFEALVAGPGFSETSLFTTPNQLWVPQFAIAHDEITTYSDGRWGLHEYSRWPQCFDRTYIHVACIPRQGSPWAPQRDVVWRTWQVDDWVTGNCGVARLGTLKAQYIHELDKAAEEAIKSVNTCRREIGMISEVARFLTLCLRHCVDRLRLLPSERSVVVSLASHVQRLTLELMGIVVYLHVVFDRITSSRDYRLDVLDVVGAHTADPSAAQLLHRLGIPVWFQQHETSQVRVWATVMLTELPVSFSSTPSWPRLVLAVRDLSGALNTPGEWQRAMNAVVRRQLCSSHLPELIVADEQSVDAANKRQRVDTQWPHSWDSAIGAAKPTLVIQNPRDARVLPHTIPTAPQSVAEGKRVCRANHLGRMVANARPSAGHFTMNPFRQFYRSRLVTHSPVWENALAAVSPLPQPSKSVTYFLPPPWLLDHLHGYSVSPEKLGRYVHHWSSIRTFCRIRLFDRTISGRPLTIAEWRDALWGDYNLDRSSQTSAAASSSAPPGPRGKKRHGMKQSLRELFGNYAALPSYDAMATPTFGHSVVTHEAARHDHDLHARLVWELYEMNWRCELLAVDALMMKSNDWPELERWVRESHISEVWGASRSGMNIAPMVDQDDTPFCWGIPDDEDWAEGRDPLRAFVDLVCRWPSCPEDLRRAGSGLETCSRDEYERIQGIAVAFYVRTFVELYERLPVPPVRRPPRTVTMLPPPTTSDA